MMFAGLHINSFDENLSSLGVGKQQFLFIVLALVLKRRLEDSIDDSHDGSKRTIIQFVCFHCLHHNWCTHTLPDVLIS